MCAGDKAKEIGDEYKMLYTGKTIGGNVEGEGGESDREKWSSYSSLVGSSGKYSERYQCVCSKIWM